MSKPIGTIIKTYKGQRKGPNNSSYDFVLVTYRDENGEKKTKLYDRPEIDYYIIKDKNSDQAKNPPTYISKDKVDKINVYSDLLYKDIAIRTNTEDFYNRVRFLYGDRAYQMQNLCKHPWLYQVDMELSDRIIAKFYDEFEADANYKTHNAYFDIEVDLLAKGKGDESKRYIGFPSEDIAPCPVNIITYFDAKSYDIHTFIVLNEYNEYLMKFRNEQSEEFKVFLKEYLQKEHNVEINEVNLYFFEEEIKCIEAFYDVVHECNPDYLSGWNICFDCKTLMNRMKKAYEKDPVLKEQRKWSGDVMSTKVADSRLLYQTNDNGEEIYLTPTARYQANKTKDIGVRIDSYTILDQINWVDSEYYFALIHNPEGKRDSYKLDSILYEELHKEKLPFDAGETIANLPWKNFWKFALYNIIDVVMLHLLERKNQDIKLLHALTLITKTRVEKVFTKSVSLINYIQDYAKAQNMVMASNKNSNYDNPPTKDKPGTNEGEFFAKTFLPEKVLNEPDPEYVKLLNHIDNHGAFVLDPDNVEANGIKLGKNKYSKYIRKNVIDQDLESLYPSILRALNLDPNTLIGKFYIKNDKIKRNLKNKFGYEGIFNLSSKSKKTEDVGDVDDDDEDLEEVVVTNGNSRKKVIEETDDLSAVLVDEIMSQNWNSLGNKFLNLPTVEEMAIELENKLYNKCLKEN